MKKMLQPLPYEKIKTYQSILLSVTCLLVTPLSVAAGEWATQVYAGMAFTNKHNAHVKLPQAGLTATHKGLRFDSAALLGLRETYWVIPWVGIGIDVSHFFGPDQKKQISSTLLCIEGDGCSTSPEMIKKFNNRITSVSPLIAFRYPLNILQQPVHSYVGIGPTLFIARLRDTSNFIPPRQASTSTSVGIKAYGGLDVFFNRYLGAFVEYQYNSLPVHTCYYNERVVNGITLGKTQGRERFNIHSIVVGISLKFSTLTPWIH